MSATRNDGKVLERLVAMVESVGLPPGFTVETNKPVYEDGQQIAELDILITGKIGTVPHKTLFECRDRQGGAQGVGWIEQLVGRRQRLKVNAIVAVSTTGFAPGAEKFAADSNIPLRNVEDVTAQDVLKGIPLSAPVIYRQANFDDVKFVVIPEDQTMEDITSQEDKPERIQFGTNDKILRHKITGDLISLVDVWKTLLTLYEEEIYGGVTGIKMPVKKTVEVRSDVRDEYRVELQGNVGKIETLIYYATVENIPSDAPLAYCKSYDERHIIAHWDSGDGGDNFTVVLTKKE